MGAHRVAIVLSILVLAAGAAGAQMVWIPFEGNPVLPPVEPGTWYAQGRWVQSMVLVDETFHLSTNSEHALMGIFGLENGVTVALPPGKGDVLPILAATSQNFTK